MIRAYLKWHKRISIYLKKKTLPITDKIKTSKDHTQSYAWLEARILSIKKPQRRGISTISFQIVMCLELNNYFLIKKWRNIKQLRVLCPFHQDACAE